MNNNYNFTRFPNKILNKIISLKLNGTQTSIILALIRATYGFHEESRELGIKFFVKVTHRNRDTIAGELKNLIDRKIIRVKRIQTFITSRELAVNEDLEEWM